MASHGKRYRGARALFERQVPVELAFDQVKKLD